MRRSDETAASCDLVDTESAHCFEGSLTEVLGEHILSLVSLAMAGVAHHGDGHLLVNGVLGEHTLESIGEGKKLVFVAKPLSSTLGLKATSLDWNCRGEPLRSRPHSWGAKVAPLESW